MWCDQHLCLGPDRLQDGGRLNQTYEIIFISSLSMGGRLCEKSFMFIRPCSCSCLPLEPKGGGAPARCGRLLVSVGGDEKTPVGFDGGLGRWSQGAQKCLAAEKGRRQG